MRGRYRAGQSIAIGRGIITIVGIGILFTLASAFWSRLHSEALDTVGQNSVTAEGIAWTTTIWNNVLLVVLAVTVIGIIALAVYQRQGGV